MSTPLLTPETKQQLRDIRRVCKLGALKPDQLAKYFVETEQARDPHANLRLRVSETLEDNIGQDSYILVFGHGGSGKSTELVKLTEELGPEFFTVNFSILDHLDILNVSAVDILVVVAEQIISKAATANLTLREDLLRPIYDWFFKETVTLMNSSKNELTVAAKAGIGNSLMAMFVELMVSIRGDIKLSTDRTASRVRQMSQRPSELVAQVNALIDSVRDALPRDRRLLIIVEDADKLDIRTAKQVFIDDANLLTSISGDIIYTIPLSTCYSPDSAVLDSKFSQKFSLPMIKVANSQGQISQEGFDKVKEIIRKRISEDQLTEAAADLLIEKTGGVLQHVFEVINTAAFMTDATVPLEKRHIEYGLQRKKREMQGDITIPVGGISDSSSSTVSDLFDRLAKHLREQRNGREVMLPNDQTSQVLLKTCALVEYNGKSWHGVHPLVQEILSDLRLI